MASGRRRDKDASLNEYEEQRLATIAENKRRLEALNIPTLSNMNQHGRTTKRTKRIHNTSDVATEGHNLRARPQKNCVENGNEQINEDLGCESMGDFLCDNEDSRNNAEKKRKGRGITRLDEIFARKPSMPKIKVELNKYGQPIGDNCRRFSSALGCHVRRKLSVGCSDWRLVDPQKKYEVWEDMKKIYDIDDAAFSWFMDSAGRKWKDFKSTLKHQFFDENISDADLKERHKGRVNDDDWKFLTEYWRSSESETRSEIAKDCRSKVGNHHTSGSKSFACSAHELANKLRRSPRRDEVYIKTHTRKNGVPSRHAEPIINKLKAIVEAHPELKQRTIQEGDAFAAACGEKEPRGRVRALGLGPTPQDVGTPGLKCYTPTRLQMEGLARKKAECEKVALQQRITELEEQMQEERMARELQDVELISHNGSNSRQNGSRRYEEHDVEAHHDAQFVEDEDCAENHINHHCDDGEQHHQNDPVGAAPTVQHHQSSPVGAAPTVQCHQNNHVRAAPTIQRHQNSPIGAVPPKQPRRCITTSLAHPVPPRNEAPSRIQHDELVGKDVILYAIIGPEQPVAKGTIISTNPNTLLGGVPLGKEYCEVIVNIVLKRDAILPCPYGYVETMADAHQMSVAWLYKRMKISKASGSPQGIGGGWH
ncbi:uncharacterized protein [Zea mays]|uniref:uncharacterized protein n=1 Tax=Zea mays TaxID=4577 RepID=UPI0009AA6A2B|nr:uncharacterized protein LOC103632553 [Zea mays]|eukprot:XP_008652536.2 uncharacterized protein LOC103632553 isoform X1 [Zea mays]